MKYINKYSALVLLIIITFTLLIAYTTGLYKTFTIKLDDTYSIEGVSDAVQGGESTIDVEQKSNGILFKCNIVAEYRWPYCELKIHLVPQQEDGSYQYSQGYDLSEYDEIYLNADYTGQEPERLRIYLRNYNPIYTDFVVDENSMKINELKFSPNKSPHGEYFKLTDFNVSSWWSGERDLPQNIQGLEFTNVPLIEIASSGYVEYGEMEVLVREITFRRLYISKESLLLITIAMWVSSALIYLIIQSHLYRIRLKEEKHNKHRLLDIMHALKLEKNEMDKMAKRDALTGLRNRAGLSKHFSECTVALSDKQIPFSIIFIDIDFFKQVNDVHGHNIGDDILISFSQVIYSNIRIADKLGRWGGEEFILICKNSDLDNAMTLAEKLCCMIEQQTFVNDLKITASFGVAEKQITESTRDFIERADQALYKAKSSGRNQVQAGS